MTKMLVLALLTMLSAMAQSIYIEPGGTISCEKMPNLCPPAKGVVGIQAERDLAWSVGTTTIHRPYVLVPGDVVKVYDRDLVPECHVVIVTFNKKTKFVKIDCKELYD